MRPIPEFKLPNLRDKSTLPAILFSAMLVAWIFGLSLFYFGTRQSASRAANGAPDLSDVVRYPLSPLGSVKLSPLAELGRKMFFDPSLSGSGKLACASCHSPAFAYGPPNGLAVQLGGPNMKTAGVRAVPSLDYLEHTPTFTIGPNSAIPDTDAPPPPPVAPAANVKVAAVAKASTNSAALAAAASNVPQGGIDWDGRAQTIQQQAREPMFDPHEMDNHSVQQVVDHLKKAYYADDMKKLFGQWIFAEPGLALDETLYALVRFQLEDPSFHRYDSKYDAYLAGKATLTAAEKRGLKLFEDPKKGNCSSCHIDKPSRDGLFRPVFTDYQFEALGAPRNKDIAANRDPHYYDLGLCGPYRKDYAHAGPYCGLFKTPTLRNVATRRVFFHNGVFHSLKEVLHFYVERSTEPAKWYPKLPNGQIDVYDDLPPQYKKNVDVVDAPFDRKQGEKPALTDAEIDDVIAFLKTLTDGYQIQSDMNGRKQARN